MRASIGAAIAARRIRVRLAPVRPSGHVDLDALANLIDPELASVSIMMVNNEIGTVQPIEEIAALCRKVGTVFHCDAAQAVTAMNLDVDALGIDMMSLSSHKLYGPKGIGALFVSHAIRGRMRPIIHGGGQESGLRSGTLPAPLCVGFGAAANILRDQLARDLSLIRRSREAFLQTLRSVFPDFKINGRDHRHPGNLNLHFPGIDAETLTSNLQPTVAISTGAACASGMPEPSHVLRAIGLTAAQAGECVRIGFGRFTNEQQARDGAHLLADVAVAMICVG